MKIAVMQPYFLPYIGYFQLIGAVDKFVVYDNIEYTKKGWINRNRMLVNGKDQFFTIPLKKDSDFLNVNQRVIAESFQKERLKLVGRIKGAYSKAPYFKTVSPLINKILTCKEDNLFKFIYCSLTFICEFLNIETELVISSEIPIDHSLKSQAKVIALCKTLGATKYINPIGGTDLYSKKTFKENQIELNFLQSKPVEYSQFNHEFIPWLSILDVMMFNSKEKIHRFINSEYAVI